MGGEVFVEGEGEGEQLDFGSLFVGGFDLFDVEFGVFHDGVVEASGVVEDVAGAGAVRRDGGGGEAEVGVVVEDLLVYGLVVDGDGDDGELGSDCVTAAEEAAVEVVVGGGGLFSAIARQKLDADVVEFEGLVAVVGDDDADGQEAVRGIWQAEEFAVVDLVAGVGGDGDFFGGVRLADGVLGGGLYGGCGARFVGGDGRKG